MTWIELHAEELQMFGATIKKFGCAGDLTPPICSLAKCFFLQEVGDFFVFQNAGL